MIKEPGNTRRSFLAKNKLAIGWIQVITLLFWSIAPLRTARAVFVPNPGAAAGDEIMWAPLPGEPALPPAGGPAAALNADGVEMWFADFQAAVASGQLVFWQGGTFPEDGLWRTFGGQWHAPLGDSDNDGIPNGLDLYPEDASNRSFQWNGGTFTKNGIRHAFRAGLYAGTSADANNDGLPDCLDSWFTDPSSHGALQAWEGGTILINGEYSTFEAVSYYAETVNDGDGDGLPDEIDPFPSDTWNGTTYEWGPYQARVDGRLTPFLVQTYGGFYLDTDGDQIPDEADPYPEDPTNNTAWWDGGTYGDLAYAGCYHAANAPDENGNEIPDDIEASVQGVNVTEPAPTFWWPDTDPVTLTIQGVEHTFEPTLYSGEYHDTDGDGIPDPADPFPELASNDPPPTSGNSSSNPEPISEWWPGGTFGDYAYQGCFHNPSAGDGNGDGIPDDIDLSTGVYVGQQAASFTWPETGNSAYYTVANEVKEFFPNQYPGEWLDTDGEGIPDVADPFPDDPYNQNDSDGDGLPDAVEVLYPYQLSMANPLDAGYTREDGLSYLEAYRHNPNLPLNQMLDTTDSDGDSMSDLQELIYGLDPNNALDSLYDSAGDFVLNVEKVKKHLPLATYVGADTYQSVTGRDLSIVMSHNDWGLSVAERDWDGDGVSNQDELLVFKTNLGETTSKPTDAEIVDKILSTQVSATTLMNYQSLVSGGTDGGGATGGGTTGGGTTGGGSGDDGSGGGSGGSVKTRSMTGGGYYGKVVLYKKGAMTHVELTFTDTAGVQKSKSLGVEFSSAPKATLEKQVGEEIGTVISLTAQFDKTVAYSKEFNGGDHCPANYVPTPLPGYAIVPGSIRSTGDQSSNETIPIDTPVFDASDYLTEYTSQVWNWKITWDEQLINH
ncbi:MAG: hypothetical protein JNM99_17590 [Verrucomicrobiaceae bacterium]|nr:hypothetical protein [Verrucomicrobiaceae bacterium]